MHITANTTIAIEASTIKNIIHHFVPPAVEARTQVSPDSVYPFAQAHLKPESESGMQTSPV